MGTSQGEARTRGQAARLGGVRGPGEACARAGGEPSGARGPRQGRRRKEREGEVKEKRKTKKKKKKRKRGRERAGGKFGGDRDGRSRVGDRQPHDAGWDGGEEKEGGYGRRKKEKMEQRLKSDIRTAEILGGD